MYLRFIAILGALSCATVACSIVDDGRVESVTPPAELTNTLPPPTIATTSTTEAVTTTIGLATSTTEVQAEAVTLFFISNGKLSSYVGSLSLQYAPTQLMALLQFGPIDDPISIGLRNAIPADVEIGATQDGFGVALVTLPEGFFDTIPAGDQRLAVGQMVMTLLANIPGVGQVAFNTQVSGPEGELIPAGQLLTRADFVTLMADGPTAATTATTVSASSTTTTLGA